jgi:hypothetical protein
MSHNYQTGVITEYSHRIRRELGFSPAPLVEDDDDAPTEIDPRAIKLESALSDHKWHYTRGIVKNKNEVTKRIYNHLKIAVSDSGYYICIPGDNTPELAPDGT